MPLLAKRVDRLPDGDRWMFEATWDGFRALVFRDGSESLLQSRDKRPLDRYVPERVVERDGSLDFEVKLPPSLPLLEYPP